MSTYKISGSTLTSIADAIRRKTGSSDLMYVSDMASNIDAIPGFDPITYAELVSNTMSILSSPIIASIPASRFSNCIGLRDVNLPALTHVGDYAFSNCKNMSQFYAPNLTNIGGSAFREAKFFPYSDIEYNPFENVTWIGTNAFYSATLPSVISIPKLTIITTGIFASALGIQEAYLPSVSSIAWGFQGCSSLISVHLPICTAISGQAFGNCYNLTTVDAPNVTTLNESAFTNCYSLTQVNFPSVSYIGTYVFYNGRLTSALFPKVGTIYTQAFTNNLSLSQFSAPKCYSISTAVFASCSQLEKITLSQLSGSYALGQNAFLNCSKLTQLDFTISSNVMIGNAAFQNCHLLSDISMLYSAAALGTSTFASCSSLTEASFPNIRSIPSYAFINCTGLSKASFVTPLSIYSYCFSNCTSFKELYLSGSVMAVLRNAPSRIMPNTPFLDPDVSDAYIYVPSSLIATYQANGSWSALSSRFSAYEFPEVQNE